MGYWKSYSHSCYMTVYMYMCNEFPPAACSKIVGKAGFSFDWKQLWDTSGCHSALSYQQRLTRVDSLVQSDLMFFLFLRWCKLEVSTKAFSFCPRMSEKALWQETEMETILNKAIHTFVVSCRRLAAVSRIGGSQLWRQRARFNTSVCVVQLMDFKFKNWRTSV